MELIEFRELYLTDYHLCSPYARNQQWNDGQEYFMLKKCRPSSLLVYLKDSRAEYRLESGECLRFSKGSVVYLPQGCRYRSRFFACGSAHAHTQIISFRLTDLNGNPFVCSRDICEVLSESGASRTFDEAVRISGALSVSYGEFKVVLYGLLTKIAAHHQKKALHSKVFFPIAPAIRCLQNDPCTDVSVQELAQMCHVSENCFRTLFKQYSGKTPLKFCLEKRIQRAEQLLQSNMYSVSEVAELVGFKDPGYFTKVFKKETGKVPSGYFDHSLPPDPKDPSK